MSRRRQRVIVKPGGNRPRCDRCDQSRQLREYWPFNRWMRLCQRCAERTDARGWLRQPAGDAPAPAARSDA